MVVRVAGSVPVAFFAMVLGLIGLGSAWRAATAVWGLPGWVGETILGLGSAVWLVLLVLYAAKWLAAPAAARAEAEHPVQCCFIALVPVSTLLVAVATLPYARPAAVALFAAGLAGQLAFGLWRTGRLWLGGRPPETVTPIMYLPLGAGNFVTAIAAGALGWAELGLLFFGAAFFSSLALESVILGRLYLHPPLPPPLRASLGIQPAPALVGLVAWLSVTEGRPDGFAVALLGYGILQILMLLRLLPFLRAQPFGPAWWAFTFATAALAIAAIRFVERGMAGVFEPIAVAAFLFTNLVIGAIAAGTLLLLARGRLLPPTPVAAPAGAGGRP